MTFESAKAWEGQIIDGKFPLQQCLGGSGHSAVFLTEVGPAKAVIKLFAADTRDANLQLLRWQQASQLSHPHLLRLFTQGRCEIEHNRLLYVVMDYAEENLSEILCHRALTAEETRDLLQSLLDALAYLHRDGLVHSRIRPPNILAQGNRIQLSVDCIGASGDASGATRRGSVYDAPELGTEALSPAADVWSLGAALVEALTQHPVVSEPSLYKEIHIPEAVPEPFRTIARNCLRRDPAQRPTIAEIKDHLKAAPSVPYPTASAESKSSHVRLLIPVAAIVLLAAVFVGPKLLSRHEEPATENRGKVEQPASTSGAPAVAPTATSPPAKVAPTRTASNGEVVRQVLPSVPPSARNTIHGHVKVAVRLQVDQAGKVTAAELANPGPSKYFARLALRAAEQWQFTPPQAGGQPVPSAWILRFQFGRTGTQVFPAQEHR